MNWGRSIVLAFVLFAGFVFYLVYRMIVSGNDLIRPKSYKSGEEINQEVKIQEWTRENIPSVSIAKRPGSDAEVEVRLKTNLQDMSGTAELFCLSQDGFDGKFPFQPLRDSAGLVWVAPLQKFASGSWLVEIRGQADGRPFFIRRKVKL